MTEGEIIQRLYMWHFTSHRVMCGYSGDDVMETDLEISIYFDDISMNIVFFTVS